MTKPAGLRENIQEGAALFVALSTNAKIRSAKGAGEVSTTYASIKGSCPDSCAMKADKSCYAQNGHVGLNVARLDAALGRDSANDVADSEVEAISKAFRGGPVPQDGAKGGRDLRLHTAGDCRTQYAANELGRAAIDWRNRGGGDVWTYTHAWRSVSRNWWGPAVSVLASVDNPSEYQEARSRGYALARVVSEHPADGRAVTEHGVRWIPCPAQTRDDIGCADCRLCMHADKLRNAGSGIQFAAHGSRASTIKRRLQVVS